MAEAINEMFGAIQNIETQNSQLLLGQIGANGKLDSILSRLENSSSTIRHILPHLRDSIVRLQVRTANKYLNTIWIEVQSHNQTDYSLQASILYLQGECARFAKDVNSKSYHERAYELMRMARECDAQIIAGVIYEACRSRDYAKADAYSKELSGIAPNDYWGYVSKLMQADNLTEAVKALPEGVNSEKVLATCIMLGGGRKNEMGIDLVCYQYHSLESISMDNMALWVLDLSVAMTRFYQSFIFYMNIKDMNTPQNKEFFALLDKFLNELQKTEIENPIPDTYFLHAATGYFGNQDKTWLDILASSKLSQGLEEMYNLTYAIILNDAGLYMQAKELLCKYTGDGQASILNMRFALAARNSDDLECIDVFKCASERKVSIPDHLVQYYFVSVHQHYDLVKEYAANIVCESDLVKDAYSAFIDFKRGNHVDMEFIRQNKTAFPYSVAPFMAIIAKEEDDVSLAIEILESVADHKILDVRTRMLIGYYREDKKCTQKLYHLLKDLRIAGSIDSEMLYLELKISNQARDYENSLSITSELIKLAPEDVNAWVCHVLALFQCGGNESDIIELKTKFENAILSPEAVTTLFNIYHGINETLFALDLLYAQIVRTQDQNLKDFMISIQIWSGVDKLISAQKNYIECGDFVTLSYEGCTKECVISKGSVYEQLVGCRVGDQKELIISKNVTVEILAIHTKYFKLLRDIYKDLGDNHGSTSIKTFSIDDLGDDPIATLQKIAGRTEEVLEKEKAALAQYRSGTTSLCNFINDHEIVSDIYDKLFGPRFMLCSLPVRALTLFFDGNEGWKQVKIVLDITSVVALYEFDRKYGLKYEKLFYLPKSVSLIIKELLLKEEKGSPGFISQDVVDSLGYEVIDKTKSIIWNKLKSLEAWIGNHCIVETVEEIINMDIAQNDSLLWRAEMESLLLASRGMLFLTEDWCFSKLLLNQIPILSVYQWLSLMEIEHADAWGQFMLECGNVGYPMSSEYIRSQHDLMSNSSPNNFQTCLENVK